MLPLLFKVAAQTSASERIALAQFVDLIRTRATEAGLENPYIVAQEISRTYINKDKFVTAGFDAISDYAGAYGGSTSPRD